jgi:hypothetical protein
MGLCVFAWGMEQGARSLLAAFADLLFAFRRTSQSTPRQRFLSEPE